MSDRNSRPKIFICYAHNDNESQNSSTRWLERLLEQLKPLQLTDKADIWSDQDIQLGADRNKEIKTTLEQVFVAVLLVSPSFLASQDIRNSVLPRLLDRRKNEEVIILPVIVRDCLWQKITFKYPDPKTGPEEFSLSSLQVPTTEPLNSLSPGEQDKILSQIAQRIYQIINSSISLSNSLTNIRKINFTKIKVLTLLKNNLSTKDTKNQLKVSEILKSYIFSIERTEVQTIKKENLDRLIERIINYEPSNIFRLLKSLIDDNRLDDETKELFENTLNNLREQLAINEPQFRDWTSSLLTPDNQQDEKSGQQKEQKSYLILKIDKSDNQSKKEPEYQLTAWLLDSIENQPTDENYDSLNEIIQEHEKDHYTQQELKPILTQLINECYQRIGKKHLIIECFVSHELLSTNFDCWECYFWGDPSQLRRITRVFVHVRSVLRLDPKYKYSPLKLEWESRWQEVNQRFSYDEINEKQAVKDPDRYFSNSSTVWANLCSSNSENLVKLFNKILRYGIPIAIWSRCHQQEKNHRQEINRLICQCNGQVQELPNQIRKRRIDSPSDLKEEPENLGHHLSLLWEDPYRLPPISSQWTT